MAFKIIWSLHAREDLRQIIWYIKQDNAQAAETLGYGLIKRVDILENHPKLGRIVPELGNEDFRELIFRSYRIVYQVMEKERLAVIVRVWHGARGEPEIPEQVQF